MEIVKLISKVFEKNDKSHPNNQKLQVWDWQIMILIFINLSKK